MSVPAGIALAWHKLHRRTRWLASYLGLKLYHFREPPPYIMSSVKTLATLIKERPYVVLVQGTHGPLLLLVLLLKPLLNYTVVMDMHSGFIIPFSWKSFVLTLPFNYLLRWVDLIILHEPSLVSKVAIRARKNRVTILFDPPIACKCTNEAPHHDANAPLRVVFPSGGLSDEPIEELVEAINKSGVNVELVITGPHKPRRIGRAVFTGYLDYTSYLKELCRSSLVLALTKLEHTILGAAWEALYCGKPLILSNTLALRSVFGKVALFASNVKEAVELLKHVAEHRELLAYMAAKANEYVSDIKIAFGKQLKELIKALYVICNRYRDRS